MTEKYIELYYESTYSTLHKHIPVITIVTVNDYDIAGTDCNQYLQYCDCERLGINVWLC